MSRDMSLGDATVLFAILLGALVCAAEIVPAKQVASVAVSTSKEDRLPVVVPSKCALETWPNITTDCLRSAGSGRPLGNARLIVAEHQ
jgi:hypothetical protein